MTRRIGTIALLLMLVVSCYAQQTGLIRKIIVEGNKQVSTQAILAAMRTKEGQPYLQSNLDADRDALDNLGFFQNVDVRAQAGEKDDWDIHVTVLEFPIVKEIRIVGNTAFPTDQIRKLISVEPGKIFNLRDQLVSTRKINELYGSKGYFARIEEFGPMRESPNTINIVIRERMIAAVQVEGNSRTKASVFAKLIKSQAGKIYDEHKWEADLRRIYSTQWFENVRSVQTTPPDDPYKINLIADVKETRTGQFNIGMQLDPRSSLAGVVKLQDSNFRGTGQSVGIDVLQATSGGGPSVGLDYANPFVDSHDTAIHASVYSRLVYRFSGGGAFGFGGGSPVNGSNYTERRTGFAIGFSRPVNDVTAWGINSRFERVLTNDGNTTSLGSFIKQDGDVGVFSLGLTRNRRDTDIDPSRGDWFRVQLEPGFSDITNIGGSVLNTSILGQHPFVKYNFEIRKYWTSQKKRDISHLDDPRKVLAFRLFYGAISGKTPFFEQYFAGGPETVHGYDQDRFWGNNTLLSNVELRIPVQKAFSVIGFLDYGGAWGGYGSVNNFTQSDKFNLHLGYGIGFSFRTPLGPLRLDLGFDERGKSRTSFLIGTSF